MGNFSEAGREIMWNISGAWLMYALFVAAMAVFAYGLWGRIRFWLRGRADDERLGDLPKRALFLVKELLLQRRVFNSRYPGFFHSLIFYSFVILIITTSVVAWDYDFGNLIGITLFHGWLYVILSVAAEAAGVLILVGAGMAVWRRYLVRPATLETGFADHFALAMVVLLVVTGFLAEGLRIAVIGDPWALLTPVGYLLSFLFAGAGESAGRLLHQILWWTHTVAAMGWIATIPYTKFVHLLTLPANMFFAKLAPRGSLKRVDLETLMMADDFDEASFSFGIQATKDLTWKQRLDFDACISCGRCEDVCPAYKANLPFSPRQFIKNCKDLVCRTEAAKPALAGAGSVGAAAAVPSADIVGQAFDEEFIWHCRTCMACMEVCPACIDHVDTMVDIRRNEVIMQGRIPHEAARSMKMLESLGNPFGPQSDRIDWIEKLGIRTIGPGESCDVIYWIGCCTTFDPTKQKIASDLCTLLKRCGIEFGVLGSDEQCCGDPARLVGQEHLFQSIAKAQVERIQSRNFKVMLVSCPHCYNVLKNEYPQFGAKFTVAHHSEFLHEMVWDGTLAPEIGSESRVVYHDPCYLGRYQKIYDSPREVIRTIPGLSLAEMENHHDKSLCCGGGGGHFWMDIKKGERINNLRVRQAADAGADTIITSCAYCMQMLDDSVKIMNLDDRLKVKDLATLVLESLDQGREVPKA